MTKVSAANISALSSSEAVVGVGKKTPPMPARDEMIAALRTRLSDQITQSIKKSDAHEQRGEFTLAGKFNVAARRAELSLAEFNDMLTHLPDGFELVPVLYTKVDTSISEAAGTQFRKDVRGGFAAHVAGNHENELRELGLQSRAIRILKSGSTDVRVKGDTTLALSVDHIIERAGSGKWATTSGRDATRSGSPGHIKYVNHFNNLMLMPDSVHQFKNKLNSLQIDSILPGMSRWILMMAPKDIPGRSGFVCPPQESFPELFGNYADTKNVMALRLRDLRRLSKDIFGVIETLLTDKTLYPLLTGIERSPHAKDMTVSEAVTAAGWDAFIAGIPSLSATFNAVALSPQKMHSALQAALIPSLHAFVKFIKDIERDVLALNLGQEQNRRLYALFIDTVRSERMDIFKRELSRMPLAEAQGLIDCLEVIDARAAEFETGYGPLVYKGLLPAQKLPVADPLKHVFAKAANDNKHVHGAPKKKKQKKKKQKQKKKFSQQKNRLRRRRGPRPG